MIVLVKPDDTIDWPSSFFLLHYARIGQRKLLAFGYSNLLDKYAIIPINEDRRGRLRVCHHSIIFERKFESDLLTAKIADFAAGCSDESLPRDTKFVAPRGFEVLDTLRVARDMRIAFAYRKRTNEYAILRRYKSRLLPPVIVEKRYESLSLADQILRFAERRYRNVRRNRAGVANRWSGGSASSSGAGGTHVRGYTARRPNVKLGKQTDWGDS